jgi:hypothetical protein
MLHRECRVPRQDLRVDRLHGRSSQMANCFAQDKRLKSAEFFLISRFAAAPAFFGSIVGRTGVKTIEPPSCTVTVTWSPTFTRAKSMSAASKMMPCELPTFEIVLVMR